MYTLPIRKKQFMPFMSLFAFLLNLPDTRQAIEVLIDLNLIPEDAFPDLHLRSDLFPQFHSIVPAEIRICPQSVCIQKSTLPGSHVCGSCSHSMVSFLFNIDYSTLRCYINDSNSEKKFP
nr:MAG TPA: hypothetical protein [Caudoviricetes sp.]